MSTIESMLLRAAAAGQAGRKDEVLGILSASFERLNQGEAGTCTDYFATMFQWAELVDDFPPARAALVVVRSQQMARLLGGDDSFGPQIPYWPQSRFGVIVEIDEMLRDSRASYTLFVQLLATLPEVAQRHRNRALPVIVEAGDFALAERYMPDPLPDLERVNSMAHDLPLFPPSGGAPRLAAELTNFMTDVRLRAAILNGRGRVDDALALQAAALAGIESGEVRSLAQREHTMPGAISTAMAEHLMKLEDGQSIAAAP